METYTANYLKAIKNAKSDDELQALINKIYEDGFTDGQNDAE